MMKINTIAGELNNCISNTREEMRKQLVERGCQFNKDNSEVILATDNYAEMKLVLRGCKDKDEGVRKYQLLERDASGKEYGTYSDKSFFTPDEIKSCCKRFQHRIEGFEGQYSENIDDIIKIVNIIERNRLLMPHYMKNAGVQSTDEIEDNLRQFMLNNPEDERIVALKINGQIAVGVVGRGKYTSYKNVIRLLEEIAPYNKAKVFLDEYYNRHRELSDTLREKQKTLGVTNREAYEIRGDKMYCFDFGEEENKRIYEKYNTVNIKYKNKLDEIKHKKNQKEVA